MRKLMLLCAWLCAMAFVVAANPVQAAGNNNVSWVSNTGTDSNNCSTPALACSLFQIALANTVNGGEIDCLNTGYYGGDMTITQSVTIDCGGSVGGSVGNIIINGTGVVVRLRNLTIDGFGSLPSSSIDAQKMAALYIENCVIIGYDQTSSLAIKFEPSSGESILSVSNTIISNNGGVGGGNGGGIEIAPTSGATASVTLDGVKLLGNVYGIGLTSAGGTIVGALRHSVISGSNVSGLVAVGGGSPIFWTVDDSIIMNNPSYGVQTLGSGVNVQVSGSTITGNGTGVSGQGIMSFGNNRMSLNATNGSFSGTTPLQ